MTALFAAGSLLCAIGFVVSVRRHNRSDCPVGPFSRAVLVESLWIAPAIGLGIGALAAVVTGALS